MIKTIVRYGEYRDSVILMGATERIQKIPGVGQAVVFMATPMNKVLCKQMGLLSEEAEGAAPDDLIVGLEADRAETIEDILNRLEELLTPVLEDRDQALWEPSLGSALDNHPEANLALISLPGEFVGPVARRALDQGLNLFIFSDNVPLEEEVRLKEQARDKGLLVMGPGCGCAVVNGRSLGLMSSISPGPVGLVGASGSGIQEICMLLDRMGLGVTQAIGTGGRDLSDRVGGITMLQGMEALARDDRVEVVVLVSKPPDRATMKKVLEAAAQMGKPVVVNFLGGDPEIVRAAGCSPARTLEDAARAAARLLPSSADRLETDEDLLAGVREMARVEKAKLSEDQKYFRGLFCGGTHCDETIMILVDHYPRIFSNTGLAPCLELDDPFASQEHTLVDMGAEEFTQGRAHPVVDPTPLKLRILKEGADPQVAVILLDILIGHGIHPDPAGFLADSIARVIREADRAGRRLIVAGSVCGTEKDPQVLSRQERTLREAGMLLFPSNARASLFVGFLGLS